MKSINETESNLKQMGLTTTMSDKEERKKKKSDQLLLKEEFEKKLMQGAAVISPNYETKKVKTIIREAFNLSLLTY